MKEGSLHVHSINGLITISDAKVKQRRYIDHWAVRP